MANSPLGISLKDIKYLFKKHSSDYFVKFTRDRVKQIEAEIQKLTQIKEAFAAKAFFIEKIKALPLNEIGIVFQKAQPLSYVINLDDPSGYSDYIAFLEALVGLDFNHYHGVIVGNESILTNTPQYGVFYTIIENNPVAGADAVKPQGDYAVAYHTGNIAAISSTYEKLLAFIDANDLSPQSDFYEEYLVLSSGVMMITR
jgi:hypothetical protein